MANTMQVDVVSAEAQIFSGLAEFVALPGEAGELGIYPKHTPLITRIRPGAVRIEVAGGGDLDEAKALEAKKQAEEMMLNQESKIDYAKAQAEMAAAIAQLAAIQKLRSRRG